MKRRKYVVKVTRNRYDDGVLYESIINYYDTYAISEKQAINNIRYRVIGKKYNVVDYQPYCDRYVDQYDFQVDDMT